MLHEICADLAAGKAATHSAHGIFRAGEHAIMLRPYHQIAKKSQAIPAGFNIDELTLAVTQLPGQHRSGGDSLQIKGGRVSGAVVLVVGDEPTVLFKLECPDPVANLKYKVRPCRVARDLPPAPGRLHHPGNLPKVALIAVTVAVIAQCPE